MEAGFNTCPSSVLSQCFFCTLVAIPNQDEESIPDHIPFLAGMGQFIPCIRVFTPPLSQQPGCLSLVHIDEGVLPVFSQVHLISFAKESVLVIVKLVIRIIEVGLA